MRAVELGSNQLSSFKGVLYIYGKKRIVVASCSVYPQHPIVSPLPRLALHW